MKLTETKVNDSGEVSGISGDMHFLKRITSIGITEGTGFETIRNDKNMPILVYVRETLIAINRTEAERIEVTVK